MIAGDSILSSKSKGESMKTVYLSKNGFKEVRKEVGKLESEEKSLQAEIREMGRAKSRDDRLKRAEIAAQLETTSSKLSLKRELLKSAKPLPRKRDRLRVAIGSVVDMVDQQGRLFRYTLVDSIEANPADGRISVDSPLGQSLVGLAPDDTVSWSAATGTRNLQLVKVS